MYIYYYAFVSLLILLTTYNAIGSELLTVSTITLSSATETGVFAIDGNYDTYAHTLYEEHPVLDINFGSIKNVSRIVVFNRQDCCQERLVPFYIVLTSAPFNGTSTFEETINKTQKNETWSVYVTEQKLIYNFHVPGRFGGAGYLRILQVKTGFLNIADIQVFVESENTNSSNVLVEIQPLFAELSQIVDSESVPYRAIDKNNATYAHTTSSGNENPWLQINYISGANISQVDIINRLDNCCDNGLTPFYLFLKYGEFLGNTYQELIVEPNVHSVQITNPMPSWNIYIPNFFANKIRIMSTKGILNVAEVRAFKFVVEEKK